MTSDFYISFGNQVRAGRVKRKFSQTTLAKLSGLTRQQIANVESGRQKVFLHDAIVLMKILEIEYSQISSHLFDEDLNSELKKQEPAVRSAIASILKKELPL